MYVYIYIYTYTGDRLFSIEGIPLLSPWLFQDVSPEFWSNDLDDLGMVSGRWWSICSATLAPLAFHATLEQIGLEWLRCHLISYACVDILICVCIRQRLSYIHTHTGWWFEPLWKIWKSIGMMKFPIYGKMKNVPNHQPVLTISSVISVDFLWFAACNLRTHHSWGSFAENMCTNST